jgi:2-methylaconitate cis-trans-isomerase PrpF
LLAGEIVTRLIPEADQHFVFFDAWIEDPEFDTEFAVGNIHSGIGDFTWPSRRVVRKLGKANSYWPIAML